MGGMIGLSKMKKILTSKGAIVLTAEIINWSEENKRVKQIADLVEKISRQYI
jgi:hypothetical protein